MRLAYVLCESKNRGTMGQRYEVGHVLPVDPLETQLEELRQGLRPWALERLTTGIARDGWYAAFLTELDDNSRFDACTALHIEEVVWCQETEYVPKAEQP
ncbi:hypothetical protein JOF56_001267 [Kibdelosporangium banguiense]|uniref:Uncharacterized protein n=1 Tax=Kibdelosporangium banguiense TaxID=1365924 RepID=A0ABS4T8Y2_9PSEU|nr:hypothetical protein [Kibdelosporangium banguiense]MBP2320882.1 hypothetical protein [Kibdelosporangium banguiense]